MYYIMLHYNIHSSPEVPKPPTPKPRRSLRSEDTKENLNNNFDSSQMEGKSRRRNTSNPSETEESSRDLSTGYEDTQVTESSSEEDEKERSLRNHPRTISPGRIDYLKKPKSSPQKNESSKNEQDTSSYAYFFLIIIIIIGVLIKVFYLNKNEVQTQPMNNPRVLLSESIENLKATFYNQELDIWNDIASAINEVVSRNPKIPSIILLFANETTTMDCLATKLAHVSSDILHANSHLIFNPKDFGDDAGEIITVLNEHSPEKKKVMIIHDILNINAEAIKGLHNLCDRINPLVAEAIYILTMKTNSYQSRQKKLNFVENQIYNKLSKSIDQDVLTALVTRITDGAIVSVQSEPQLKYC